MHVSTGAAGWGGVKGRPHRRFSARLATAAQPALVRRLLVVASVLPGGRGAAEGCAACVPHAAARPGRPLTAKSTATPTLPATCCGARHPHPPSKPPQHPRTPLPHQDPCTAPHHPHHHPPLPPVVSTCWSAPAGSTCAQSAAQCGTTCAAPARRAAAAKGRATRRRTASQRVTFKVGTHLEGLKPGATSQFLHFGISRCVCHCRCTPRVSSGGCCRCCCCHAQQGLWVPCQRSRRSPRSPTAHPPRRAHPAGHQPHHPLAPSARLPQALLHEGVRGGEPGGAGAHLLCAAAALTARGEAGPPWGPPGAHCGVAGAAARSSDPCGTAQSCGHCALG